MLQEFKGVVEDRTLAFARFVLGYQGSSKMKLDGVNTYSMSFKDGSRYVIETCYEAVQTRTTGVNAERYKLVLDSLNAILWGI